MLTEAEGAVPGFMLVQSDPPIGEACPRAMGGTPAETDGPGMRSRKARNTMVDDPRRSVAMASLRRWDGVRGICPLGKRPICRRECVSRPGGVAGELTYVARR